MDKYPLMKNVSLAGTRAHPKSELDIQNLLGLGLRSQHFPEILQHQPDVAWFEIISENFMDSGGRPRHILDQISQHYPIVMHGVSLSIGSTDELDWPYLQRLKQLADDIQPMWISDHLCWTGVLNINSHDLLPLPLTEESLQHVCGRILQVQDFLKRPLVLENPSTYMHFKHSVIPEWEFFNELFRRTDCEMLLDVNNVYVSAFNNQFDPMAYLQALDFSAVRQMHLAGHQHCGNYIIDTHDRQVSDNVWPLFQYAWQQTGGVATCLEWDGNIPAFSDYREELHQAKHVILDGQVKRTATMPAFVSDQPVATPIDFLVSNTRK